MSHGTSTILYLKGTVLCELAQQNSDLTRSSGVMTTPSSAKEPAELTR
jgi:hypothetical protein